MKANALLGFHNDFIIHIVRAHASIVSVFASGIYKKIEQSSLVSHMFLVGNIEELESGVVVSDHKIGLQNDWRRCRVDGGGCCISSRKISHITSTSS